jgi:hypothetical protein
LKCALPIRSTISFFGSPVENLEVKATILLFRELLRAPPSWQYDPFFRCCCCGYLCFACYTAVVQTFIILL